ncbi:hypothetical protein VWY03_05890 [Phaeobacter sp. JH20_09]
MIICHPLKLIFIKTKKVAGTSFEIALSSYCDESSIITPISPKDEERRRALGYPGPQNHQTQTWPDGNGGTQVFFDHMTAGQIRAAVPQDIWETYTKVTIRRDPYDAMVSRYYNEAMDQRDVPLDIFVRRYRSLLSENRRIAPLDGSNSADVVLRYEHLEEDINALDIDGLWERFSNLNAKAPMPAKTGADATRLFTAHPEAADVIEVEAVGEISRFGYTRPALAAAVPTLATQVSENAQQRLKPEFIFTLSAGRTGTAWLAKFLGENLNIPSVHEPLGANDYGIRMPGIGHMRGFNTYGMNANVCDFWEGKLGNLQAPYAESNHTLGKCGLIEALVEHGLAPRTRVIILRRNLGKQIASYVNRNDFCNITIPWQWYLHPTYNHKILDPAPFEQMGEIGMAIWYALEMEVRYAYYKQLYGDHLHFIETTLEQATTPDGARNLLQELGHTAGPILPQKVNASPQGSATTNALVEEIETLLSRLGFDADTIAKEYIERGNRLDLPSLPHAAMLKQTVAAE